MGRVVWFCLFTNGWLQLRSGFCGWCWNYPLLGRWDSAPSQKACSSIQVLFCMWSLWGWRSWADRSWVQAFGPLQIQHLNEGLAIVASDFIQHSFYLLTDEADVTLLCCVSDGQFPTLARLDLSHLGDIPLGMSVMTSPERYGQGGKTYPKCEQHPLMA